MNNFTSRHSHCWVMHGNVSPDILNKAAFKDRKLSWGEVSDEKRKFIDFLELIPGVDNVSLPSVIKMLPNLKEITIPSWFVPVLTNSSIPETVQTVIAGLMDERAHSNKKRVDWIKDEVFDKVIELRLMKDGIVFSSANFPNLTHLHINISKDESEYFEINKLYDLEFLVLEKPLTINALNSLSDSNIKYLNLLSGKFPSFDDLKDIKKLSQVEIRFCNVGDLTGLKNLSSILDINIFGCKKITDIKPLADINSVVRVYVLGSGSKWNDNTLPDYFRKKGFTDIRYEPDRTNSLFEAIRS